MFHTGDIVTRKKYGHDIYFVVEKYQQGRYHLRSVHYRLKAHADEKDLASVSKDNINQFRQSFMRQVEKKIEGAIKSHNNAKPGKAGKVLHIDGDSNYLDMCMNYYNQLEIPSVGLFLPEQEQPLNIREALEKHMPDILIVTGHDSIASDADFSDVDQYKSSKYFMETVKKARQFQPSKDSLCIFAGACQSFYNGIMEAGANFASSPAHIMIHALDPVLLAEKLSYQSITDVLSIQEAARDTLTGTQGIGGIQTRGFFREGIPNSE